MEQITIRQPDDFHVHFREGNMLYWVMAHTASVFGRGLIMPNTEKPVLTAEDVKQYLSEIEVAMLVHHVESFKPLMTIKLTPATTPEMIIAAFEAGAIAAKLYPEGVTTGSEVGGVKNFRALYPQLATMEAIGMVLCIHPEKPETFSWDAEWKFHAIIQDYAARFPKLRIVIEHVTDRRTLKLVESLPRNVAATLTIHHLCLDHDDVAGRYIYPHNFCKPVAKRPEDKQALIRAAISGNPKYFLGTDSAPHPRTKKECAEGCAGVYTAPIAMPLLTQVFARCKALDKLENFCSRFGAEFYNLPLNTRSITLKRAVWVVPQNYAGIVPFMANHTLEWYISGITS